MMDNTLDYERLKTTLHSLNTDDTLSSAHGILCGFACVKTDLSPDDWLNEILTDIDFDNLNERLAHQTLLEIFDMTRLQLNDATLNFQLLIADDEARLGEQANTLIEWCQGFLVGLGLQKITTTDEDVLTMIKDLSEIAKLDANVIDTEQNAQDLNNIIEFVRMGTLLIQETLQPSKQDYINSEMPH